MNFIAGQKINAATQPPTDTADLDVLDQIQRRVLWLSTLMIHYANRVRPNEDGSKVGGHQASSASVVSILTALYFDFLRAEDRVSIKPHASPVLHAVQHLLGNLGRDYLTTLRAFHGLQAYPSRTKDPDRVDFSTGSVGLGCVATNFAALAERYTAAHFGHSGPRPRFVAVVGDAELDEGSVWEAIAEPALAGLDNIIWIVDLNRQSLDRVVPGVRVQRWREMFLANGWRVIDAKYGSRLEATFSRPGGDLLRQCIDDMPNGEYQRLLRLPPSQVRGGLVQSYARGTDIAAFLDAWDDQELAELVRDLGGHDLAILRRALRDADASGQPSVIFAYTIKGWRLPIAADPLNHSALLNQSQLDELRESLGIAPDAEYDRFPPGSAEAHACQEAACQLAGEDNRRAASTKAAIPRDLGGSHPKQLSSQGALSLILSELARAHSALAERIVTASPDVATSTNLGGWINRVGVFSPLEQRDLFGEIGPRLIAWNEGPAGRHIELGISENNLFLLLSQLGLTGELCGEALFPIGTLYDPFICRGLDALMYGLYSGSGFIVVATPSGVTLSPEGGAHQSVITPSIGLELPNLTYWEPCFAVETEWILLEALRCLRDGDGTSSYLRLSTRNINQDLLAVPDDPEGRERLRGRVLAGAYRLLDRSGESSYTPSSNVVTVATSGAMVPEAIAASDLLREDDIFVNVVNVTSAGRLYRAFQQVVGGWVRSGATPPGSSWLASFPDIWEPSAPIITVLDGHPHTLAWLPSALGSPGIPLGVTDFGQSGTRSDLYRQFQIDAEAIAHACLAVLLDRDPATMD